MEQKKLGNKKKRKNGSMDDERFKTVLNDPRFDALPRKERKVVVDERFKDMLASEKFAPKSNVDMRGRCVNLRPKNDLTVLYELPSDDGSSGVESEEKKKIKIDLARGNGNITSSDEDSSSEWDLEEAAEEMHDWGETDKDACRVEWASRRLALCNMEWDRISATDIFVMISSFKPPAPATIQSVTIYKSDFGQKRLEEEERMGPKLIKLKKPVEDIEEMDEETREAMRAYQLERMRYYYAIIECDGVETASCLYEACDGVEFESSAVHLDLRFVPDDMTFENNSVKERVTAEDINLNVFKPKNFESAALSKSSAKLTWDETDPERIKAERDAFLPDADLDQVQHLLAPCSSDEENDETGKSMVLLKEAETEASKKADSLMEVTWDVEMMDDTILEKKTKKFGEPTPWEKYLEKRKAKRKERKAMIADLKKKQREEIVENTTENNIKSLTKNKLKKDVNSDERDYIDDERFKALYSNSAFAVDQSHPLFKSSKLALRQAEEKQKRRASSPFDDNVEALANKLKKKAADAKKWKKIY
ncbi:ABTAP protein [Loa loa]|uniref:ABTAP protein n=1 Tax=Loa loa TaxID=7209 RepID=A0A1I7V8K2_LOALO|nr:ABTAP protein [Loa loa]EFO23890.1 ABTAP protein [Loa loa]